LEPGFSGRGKSPHPGKNSGFFPILLTEKGGENNAEKDMQDWMPGADFGNDECSGMEFQWREHGYR